MEKGLTTQVVLVPILQMSKSRGGSRLDTMPFYVLIQPLQILQMLRNEVLVRQHRAALCTSLHLAEMCVMGHRAFDIFISLLLFLFLELSSWFLSAFVLFP